MSVPCITGPTTPSVGFSAEEPALARTDDKAASDATRSYSVPALNIAHDCQDSDPSMRSDGFKTILPYLDSSMPDDHFKSEDSHERSHVPPTNPSHDDPSLDDGSYSTHISTSPPSYTPEASAPRSSEQGTLNTIAAEVGDQNEGNYRPSDLAPSSSLSSAQQRRRRARARFGTGDG